MASVGEQSPEWSGSGNTVARGKDAEYAHFKFGPFRVRLADALQLFVPCFSLRHTFTLAVRRPVRGHGAKLSRC
jgi:hypothetical protein